jgi:DNA-binding NarL/FixJ family response regulator
MDPTRINVLLIEDNPDDHFFIERMLNHASGYLYRFEVAHAERLSTGLAYLSQNRVDLILLDLSLPDVHGLETFVITYGQADDVPIVVLSGHDDETLAARAVALGAQDYLVKGRVKHDLLARSIIYAIERKQAEAESRASERRRAGEALQASEARYRNIIEKNADGILIVDVEGVIRFINPAAETLFGCQAEELVNTSFDFPLAVGEKTEITIARRNNSGETVIAEMHLAETEWEGKTTYLASLRDVTERVQAQKALHYRVDFQKLIADISARFVQLEHYHLEDHIGQTLQMIGEFAGVDRSFILIVSNEDAALRHAYEWCAAGIPTRFNEKRNLNLSNYTWMAESLKRFGNIRVPRVTDLPP